MKPSKNRFASPNVVAFTLATAVLLAWLAGRVWAERSFPEFALALVPIAVIGLMIMILLCHDRSLKREMHEKSAALREANDRLAVDARFVEMSTDLALTADFERNVISCNGAWEQVTGWTLEDLRACPLRERFHADDREQLEAEVTAIIAGGHSAGTPMRMRCKDGSYRFLEWKAIGVPDEQLIFASARDVTERVALEKSLETEHADLRNAQKIARIGSWRVELPSGEMHWSDELYGIIGIENTGAPPTTELWLASLAPCEREQAKRHMVDALKNGGEFSFTFERTRPGPGDGVIHLSAKGVTELDDSGRTVRMTGTVMDITERMRSEAGLRRQANNDALTGLPNRRVFEEVLGRHLARCKREEPVGGLVLVDLDRLKLANDNLGHLAGDEIIKLLGRVLELRTRESELAARIGGDEFVALLPTATREGCKRYAASVHDLLSNTISEISSIGVEAVTASIGVAMFADIHELTIDAAITAADDAMYAAKRRGDGGLEIHQPMASASFNRAA